MKTDTLTFTERVRDLFLARPNVWVDGLTIAGIAGQYAWRSRISDCRRFFHMRVENRVRAIRDAADGKHYKVSEYCYVPGREERRVEQVSQVQPVTTVALTEGRLF